MAAAQAAAHLAQPLTAKVEDRLPPSRSDKLSKPRAGRYFPYAANEFVARAEELAFARHDYDDRLPVLLENCVVECPLGLQLCSFFPQGYVAQFSLPLTIPAGLARKAMDAALARLREIDAGPKLAVRDQQFVVYRAYLHPPARLSVTQHVISGGSKSYLRFRAASQLSKAQCDPDNQTVLFDAQIA